MPGSALAVALVNEWYASIHSLLSVTSLDHRVDTRLREFNQGSSLHLGMAGPNVRAAGVRRRVGEGSRHPQQP